MILQILLLLSNFTSNAYVIKYPPESKVFINENELFDREKCQTCCKIMFVSEYNPRTKQKFTPEDDRNQHTRYVMTTEFEDKNDVRKAEGNWEQTIMLRELTIGSNDKYESKNNLKYWELAPYKMFISFAIPKRVHDIRGGIKLGSRLIIWKKKEPLAASTNNQRFVYQHPYKFGKQYNQEFNYPEHISAPFYTQSDVCYELAEDYQIWTGNNDVNCGNLCKTGYQIKINTCNNENPKQDFKIVFV